VLHPVRHHLKTAMPAMHEQVISLTKFHAGVEHISTSTCKFTCPWKKVKSKSGRVEDNLVPFDRCRCGCLHNEVLGSRYPPRGLYVGERMLLHPTGFIQLEDRHKIQVHWIPALHREPWVCLDGPSDSYCWRHRIKVSSDDHLGHLRKGW